MALSLSSACLALALADERGTIEIAETMTDATARVQALRARVAA